MNRTAMKIYWNGYRYARELHEIGYSLDEIQSEIYNSNASMKFVKGAMRYIRYIRYRVPKVMEG